MSWLKKLLEAIAKAIADWIARCIPQYNPAAWNDANGIQYNNHQMIPSGQALGAHCASPRRR